MATLLERLQNAKPGDTIGFTGRQSLGKVQDVRGRADAWVTLIGEDDSAVLVPNHNYRYAVFRPENCAYLQFGQFTVDGDGWAERGLQWFHSDHLKGYDLRLLGNRYDGLHVAYTTDSSLHRCQLDGAAGEWLRPGVAPHAVYEAEGSARNDFEDGVASSYLGAPLQLNGTEGGTVTGSTYRRWQLLSWREGFGVNLLGCANAIFEDMRLETDSAEANGGFMAENSAVGVQVIRYAISLPPGKPPFTGHISRQSGEPNPPQLDSQPSPPDPTEPPPTDWEALYQAERALNDQRDAWWASAQSQWPKRGGA